MEYYIGIMELHGWVRIIACYSATVLSKVALAQSPDITNENTAAFFNSTQNIIKYDFGGIIFLAFYV